MQFKTFGSNENPAILLLHGGGLSWWSLNEHIEILKEFYYVITPVIDGHGEDYETNFISIKDSALKIVQYIDKNLDGKLFCIGGLSIGAQITCEILSIRPDICERAIIESALVIPIKGMKAMMAPMVKLSYGLIKQRWFARLQAKTLYVPEKLFEQYFDDSKKMTKVSLVNITLSNGDYHVNESIEKATAKIEILVGEKEISIMKRSANILHSKLPNSTLYVSPNMKHGELSLNHPMDYLRIVHLIS
ncbi:alpha/beta fold hydrolase [Fusibacter bizertensis]